MALHSLSALLERYRAVRAHELELNRATAEFERAVLQPLFLLNGGASVAVLGLLGAWSDRITTLGIAQVHTGLYWWSFGLVLATIATLSGYLSQRRFSQAEREDREDLEHRIVSHEAKTEKKPPSDVTGPAESAIEPSDQPGNTSGPSPSDRRLWARIFQYFWWFFAALSLGCFIAGVVDTAHGLGQVLPRPVEPPGPVTYVAPSSDANALAVVLDQASRTAPWVTPFFLLVGLGVICGLLMALKGQGKVVRAVGTALAVSSIFGGTAVTLFKDVQVKLPAINLASSDVSTAPQIERMTAVGPFSVGKADVLESQAVPAAVDPADAAKNITDKAKGRELSYVLFIGSADKFELSPQLQTQYGSNVGLAQARAEWAEQEVRRAWKGQTFESITLTVGPSMHGTGLSFQDTAGDRRVAIYVAWRDRSQEGGLRDWLKSLNTKSKAVEGKR